MSEEPAKPHDDLERALSGEQRANDRVRGKRELTAGVFLLVVGLAAMTLLGDFLFSLFGILMFGSSIMIGLALIVMGAVHLRESKVATTHIDSELILATHRRRVVRGWIQVGAGVIGIVAGLWITEKTYKGFDKDLAKYLIAFGPFVVGYVLLVAGVFRLLSADKGLVKPANAVGKRNNIQIGIGFKTFVAWRYLMARHHQVSRIVLAVFFVALFAASASMMVWYTILRRWNPLGLDPDLINMLARGVLISMIAGVALVYFCIIIGMLRYVFSFFTTVPIVGVWIGTAALIIVLSVMSGFETDLRQKILGSNAHIQVTAESGDISNWREVKAKIDAVPGVLASTPYAVSEVVIAANNNGMNVIIKGIDPKTVGKVTKVIDSIKDDKELAMTRLEPMVSDEDDLLVPEAPAAGSGSDSGSGAVVDPAPDDMPQRNEPIDYSQPRDPGSEPPPAPVPGAEPIEPTKPAAPVKPGQKAPDLMPEAGSGFGGDAEYLVEKKPIVDPAPPDVVTTDEEPIDYSGKDDVDLPIEVADVPFDQPSLSRRTQSLPGILVGQELVKQTHLYVGEEVRVVSPLSDPANPDANGTPIPFNRDYRVAGIFFTGMYEYDLKYVYVTLDSLTDFLDRGDVVDGIEIRIGNPDDAEAYVGRLKHLLGSHYRVQDWRELNRSLFSALEIEKIAMFLVLGIVILVASFSIIGNLIMVVVEKGREIALIKTLGASDRNVMLVFAIQGFVIGLIGTGLGVITGRSVCYLLEALGFPLNPDVYYIDKLPVNVETTSIVLTALSGVMISMLATFYPAIVAARVRPAAGMRH